MNQFCPATMIARTTLETHNPRISAQTVTHRLREIGERTPYTMYVLYAAFLSWPSILDLGLKKDFLTKFLFYRECSIERGTYIKRLLFYFTFYFNR